jgi:adenosine deaminase
VQLQAELEAAFALEGEERRARLVAIPKTDLHAHGLLSASMAELERIAGVEIPRPRTLGSFEAFQHYVRARLVPYFDDLDRIHALVRAALLRMIDEGVVYTELSIDVRLPHFLGISARELAAALEEVRLELQDRIGICFEAGIHREAPRELVDRCFDELLDTGCLGSVDLYGDERRGTAREFRYLYDRARERGLKLKAHSGELCGAERVRETIESLGVHAIQHGIRAAEDPSLMELLVERAIVLHVCPTSNVELGLVPSHRAHPIRTLVERGVRVTVNSDNHLVFGADVCDELVHLHESVGLDAGAIAQILQHGLDEATSAPKPTRTRT